MKVKLMSVNVFAMKLNGENDLQINNIKTILLAGRRVTAVGGERNRNAGISSKPSIKR